MDVCDRKSVVKFPVWSAILLDYMDLAVRYPRKAVKLNHSLTAILFAWLISYAEEDFRAPIQYKDVVLPVWEIPLWR